MNILKYFLFIIIMTIVLYSAVKNCYFKNLPVNDFSNKKFIEQVGGFKRIPIRTAIHIIIGG